MHHVIKLGLTIRFRSKWHIGSGEGGLLTDRFIRRDGRNRPYIPGSSLKGVVRESCEKLSRTLGFGDSCDPHQASLIDPRAFGPLAQAASPVDAIFGNKYEEGGLFFRDACLSSPPPYGFQKLQSRIRKYRVLGTAREKHLFSTEYAAPMEFSTTIDGYHRDLLFLEEEDPPYAYCLLVAGIKMVDRLGGDKSTGAGKLREMAVDSMEYNGRPFSLETVFEYLDTEMYLETREMS